MPVYRAEPTALLFHQDVDNTVKGIMGPVGTGKTVATTVMEPIYVALQQQAWWHTVKVPFSGTKTRVTGNIHHIRVMIVRKTFDRLKRTVVKTMEHWLPPDFFETRDGKVFSGTFFSALGSSKEHRYVYIEYEFVALDRSDVFDKLASFEPTLVVLSEVSELDAGVIEACVERLGRFPPYMEEDPSQGPGPTRTQVVFDLNPPHEDHWFPETFKNNPRKGWKVYYQPGAFFYDKITGRYIPNPRAENVRNIKEGYRYWQKIIDAGDPDKIQRKVLGLYGQAKAGAVVYSVFSRARHVAPAELPTAPGRLVYIGMDLETHPAATIYQLNTHGVAEITGIAWPQDQVYFEEFLDSMLLPLLRQRYPWGMWRALLDPSGNKMSALATRGFVEHVKARGIAAEYAQVKHNHLTLRHSVVNQRLTSSTVSICPVHAGPLAEALERRYKYGDTRRGVTMKPVKDRWADLVDSFQYGLMLTSPITARDYVAQASQDRPEVYPVRLRRKHFV